MKIIKIRAVLLVYFTVAFLISCTDKTKKPEAKSDTPTSGEITLVSDESVAPLMMAETNTFGAIYPEATIHVSVKSEPDAVSDLMNNKVKLIVIPRRLSSDELQYIQQSDYAPRQIKIATDAVAFLINLQNPDSDFHYQQLLDIISGKISDWKQINPKSTLGKISLIFNSNRSGILSYLKDSVLKGTPLTGNSFAVDSNAAVISYIEKNPAAIGVIGVSWISQRGDSLAEIFLKNIRVAGISSPDSSAAEIFYRPVQVNMMRRQYPFLRDVYFISREEGVGLGTGFVKYVITDEGQTIIRLFGLVPAHPPIRMIELKNEF
jgi:phosphate transport system substrate-binding protein